MLCFVSLCFYCTTLLTKAFSEMFLETYFLTEPYKQMNLKIKDGTCSNCKTVVKLPFSCFILGHTDVLPVLYRALIQTAVSYSQGFPGNSAMENSWEFPCGKGCEEVKQHQCYFFTPQFSFHTQGRRKCLFLKRNSG